MVLLLTEYELEYISAQEVFDVFYGWKGYAMIGNSYNLCRKLEEWIKQELGKMMKPNSLYLP